LGKHTVIELIDLAERIESFCGSIKTELLAIPKGYLEIIGPVEVKLRKPGERNDHWKLRTLSRLIGFRNE